MCGMVKTKSVLPGCCRSLTDPLITSAVALKRGHCSAGALSDFFHIRPFDILKRGKRVGAVTGLESRTGVINIPLMGSNDSSRSLDEALRAFVYESNFALFRTVSIVFPPVIGRVGSCPSRLRSVCTCVHRT